MSAADDQERAVATLRRVAFLLERAQARRYRSEAYRTAARTVERQAPGRLATLAAAGALTDLPGVGRSTADVVRRALAAEPVPALDELEAQTAAAAASSPEAAALHAALRGDLHSHTEASDGAAPVQEMVLTALDLGRDYLAVTDHSPRLTVAHGLSAARLRAQLADLAALRPALAPFDVLSGIEVDILDDGSLDQEPDLLDELDVVVASVHSKLRMDAAAMTRRMLAAVRNPRTDVLGHCTGRRLTGRQRPPSEFDARAVFDACAEHGVAVEINCRPDRLRPPPPPPAAPAAAGGRRRGVRLHDRLRRARPRAARLAAGRVRTGRRARHRARPRRDDPQRRRGPRAGASGATVTHDTARLRAPHPGGAVRVGNRAHAQRAAPPRTYRAAAANRTPRSIPS